jgi:hypothetical protein
MRRQLVFSTNLRSVGYENAESILEIEFKDSGLYQYFHVPVEVYQGLLAAPSKGAYFHQQIKDVFQYRKLN